MPSLPLTHSHVHCMHTSSTRLEHYVFSGALVSVWLLLYNELVLIALCLALQCVCKLFLCTTLCGEGVGADQCKTTDLICWLVVRVRNILHWT